MRELGIIMNGVTGRMGTNQHLVRSILSLREDGGVELPDGERVLPDPLLVGRDERKLRRLTEEHGLDRWTADPDLETCLDGDDEVYFDSQITPPTARRRREGRRGRQGRLLREAAGDGPRPGAGGRPDRRGRGRQTRHRPGQALAPRPAETRPAP